MPPSILLVDDDEAFIYLVGRYAEQCGFGFAHAPSLAAARAMVGQGQPALVVLNHLLVAAAERGVVAALQTDLAELDIPSAGFAPVVAAAGPAALEVDYELTLPLLYGDFCAALSALGIEQRAADEPTA